MKFYVIPVEGPIDKPTLFAVRNGVKEAIERGFDVVALDMDTPGGRLDVTLDIMAILDRFPGKTLTYINDEAISAGAIISSVTNEIYYAPKAIIGAAEPVSGQGQDIPESMKRKLMSYLNAKLEAYTEQYRYRSEVIRAMMDPDYELKIGGEVIKEKGALLSLTANGAMKAYGDPPQPLMGNGIAESLDKLLASLALGKASEVTRFEATWSLELAKFLVMLAPVLISIGVISVYIEFQTPGFGVFGITGVICFLIAIFGHNVAGLSGSEPLLLFLLGVLFLALELFLAPGTLVMAILGALLMVGSLIWSMTDIWPENTPDFEWTLEMFALPLQNLILGGLMGVAVIVLIGRFLPKSVFWNRLVLSDAITGSSGPVLAQESGPRSIIGSVGLALTDLMPTGQVSVEGKCLEASVPVGSVRKGSKVRVVSRASFGYVVEEVES